ncbi:nuclear condensing complex subunit [Lipomyces tetrasporus]
MLENLEGALKNNLTLMSMLEDLIIPSIRSHEAPVRERGLRCLGLCCLLDKKPKEKRPRGRPSKRQFEEVK